MGTQSNAQREVQLLAEWITTLPPWFKTKTHVRVGEQRLYYADPTIPASRARALEVWSDWTDCRIFTGAEVWIVEAKLVGVASAYGQVMDYIDEYPLSTDYANFTPTPIIPMVLCAAEKPRTRILFQRYGVRTVVFTPSWASRAISTKIVGDLTGL